jgi:hypothetical protein
MGPMGREILAVWKKYVVKHGGGVPNSKGFDLQLVDMNGQALAVYMAKVQEKPQKNKIGSEMGRADYKTGDGQNSWTPFDLLDDTGDETQNAYFGHLFVEYFHGTFRKQVITFSKGLRALAGVPELTDEEAAAEGEPEPERVLLYTFQKSAYDSVQNRPQLLAQIMDHAAYGETDAIAELAVPYWFTETTEHDYNTAYISDFKAKYAEGQARRAAAELLNPPIYDDSDDF